MDEEKSKMAAKSQPKEAEAKISEFPELSPEFLEILGEDDTENDLLIASMLQMEFDNENDAYIDNVNASINGNAKVTLNFKHFKAQPDHQMLDEDEDEDLGSKDPDLDLYETADKAAGQMPRCGYKKVRFITTLNLTHMGVGGNSTLYSFCAITTLKIGFWGVNSTDISIHAITTSHKGFLIDFIGW